MAGCSSGPGGNVEQSAGPLVQTQDGTADAGTSGAGTPTAVCQHIQDRLGNCAGKLSMKISCPAGAAVPHVCQASGEDYLSGGVSTWCCPAGTSLDAATLTTLSGVSCTCGEGGHCGCTGNMHVADSASTVLKHARVYVDWWGWGSPPNDPSGEMPRWRAFLQNLGGSRWLGAITQYTDPQTSGWIQNPTDLWAGEWSGSTIPLPASKWSCTQDYQCPVTNCDTQVDRCYCAADSDCDSGHCNASTGLCWPTYAQFEPEVQAAVSQLNPVDDGIILIALPPSIPWPGAMYHTSFPRSGHTGIAVAELAYNPGQTAGVEHEIAEAITNPYSTVTGHTAYVGPCNCEIADRCSPPPPGSVAQDTVAVGVTPDPSEQDTVAAIWSDNRNDYAGECVNAEITNEEYFYQSGGDVYDQNASYFGTGYMVDFGHYGSYGITGKVGAASWGHDRADVFGIGGQYHHIQHMYWNPPASPGWNDWGALPNGYTAIFSPDAFSWRPGRVDVVVVGDLPIRGGSIRTVFHRYYENGTFYGWTELGAPSGVKINSRVAAAAENVNRFDLFVLDGNGVVHHGWSTDGSTIGGWSSWGAPTGVGFVDIDAASRGDQQVEVFAISGAYDLWHKGYQRGSYYGWDNWGNPGYEMLSTVGAFGGGDGFVDSVSTGLLGHYDRFWNGALFSWISDPNQYAGPDISGW